MEMQDTGNDYAGIKQRLVRYEEGKIGEVIIVVTKNTMEEKWYQKSKENRNYKNKLIDTLNMREYRRISSKSFDYPNFKLF